jgi:small nuclear ribonucleoprotein (snRNP)-like protein
LTNWFLVVKRLLARVKAFDRHCNIVLENGEFFSRAITYPIQLSPKRSNRLAVKEMWTEKPKGGKGKGVNKDRFVSKM